jgi:hypothetical protein
MIIAKYRNISNRKEFEIKTHTIERDSLVVGLMQPEPFDDLVVVFHFGLPFDLIVKNFFLEKSFLEGTMTTFKCTRYVTNSHCCCKTNRLTE